MSQCWVFSSNVQICRFSSWVYVFYLILSLLTDHLFHIYLFSCCFSFPVLSLVIVHFISYCVLCVSFTSSPDQLDWLSMLVLVCPSCLHLLPCCIRSFLFHHTLSLLFLCLFPELLTLLLFILGGFVSGLGLCFGILISHINSLPSVIELCLLIFLLLSPHFNTHSLLPIKTV